MKNGAQKSNRSNHVSFSYNQVRSLALILLKRVLISEEIWKTLQPQLKVQLKAQFLQLVEADPEGLRHKICNLVGAVGAFIFENGT
jgi:hypothetical protein